ncbi:hypothetical protein T484DRAFT_1742604 [Baffinella frigidus]|nr:hypothetical protein T484DRAFT_1742604 [Cryptophyta sp. CCMP2293]
MDADDLRSTAPPMPGQGQNPDKLLSVPVNVQRVFVHGNERTKRALVEAELANALAAHTHRDLAIELSMATQRLEELDIFKSAVCEVCLHAQARPGREFGAAWELAPASISPLHASVPAMRQFDDPSS